ncbi:hypothetical protein F5883DRAFT_110602 [Diaporthe sp. PMI_573]|nr:hypothetical protein F5883DRAFT_110602 [Diaporthaceae sp. PMI_573]
MAEEKTIDEYFPSRDFVDINRLNLQHYLYRDIFGYNLHPTIPIQNTPNLSVIDIGTGTGVWLRDLHATLDPTTQYIGLDIDIRQAGRPEWLPPNCAVRQWDATTDVPVDLLGRFDVVNLRLFGLVIQDSPKPLLRKLIKLLKPNGYIQWCETDQLSHRVQAANPSLPTKNLSELWHQTTLIAPKLMAPWVKNLPRDFEEEGLEDVVADWKTGSQHTLMAMHWCNMPLYEMIEKQLRAANDEKADLFRRLSEGSIQESLAGAMYVFDRVVVVGRKSCETG